MTVPSEPSTSPASLDPGSVNALTTLVSSVAPDDPVQLVQDILKALETPGTSAATITSYAGEAVALAGFVVGAFDHNLGLAISAVPQATLLAASTVVAGGLAIWRLVAKSRKQGAAANLAASIHNDQASRQMAMAHAAAGSGGLITARQV